MNNNMNRNSPKTTSNTNQEHKIHNINTTLEIIKASLWNTSISEASREDFDEMRFHAIAALPAGILSSINIPEDLRSAWRRFIIQQVKHFINCQYTQERLPITVPYVILKGTSAAQYYPHPEYRSMGDIDIITSKEDFGIAYKQLVNENYKIVKENERETSFRKNGIVIELHRHFAALNNPEHAQYMDELICDHIRPNHVLPDLINGLVLLEHIDQHMENGIGLRQIIDWMMFVNKCLTDENWEEFNNMAQNVGLTKLAITVTRLCEIYLGLPNKRKWCSEANETLCSRLMDYIVSCGNFGAKRTDDSCITENVFIQAKTIKATFRLLQERGMANWQAVKGHQFLRAFAWLYQMGRYAKRGLVREEAKTKLKAEIDAAKQRNDMFEDLGIIRASKGIVIYKNGNYTKK